MFFFYSQANACVSGLVTITENLKDQADSEKTAAKELEKVVEFRTFCEKTKVEDDA